MSPRLTLVSASFAALLAIVTLTSCATVTLTPQDPDTSPSSSATPEPSPSATPAPSPSDTPTGLPTNCTDVVSLAAYASTFEGTPLNDPAVIDPNLVGVIEPVAPPAGASAAQIVASAVELRCIWRNPGADITGISIEYSRVDDTTAAQYTEELAAEGYTCTDANGGRQCQLIKPNETYPVDEGYTALAREGVVIFVQQANYPTSGLMAQLAAVVWGG